MLRTVCPQDYCLGFALGITTWDSLNSMNSNALWFLLHLKFGLWTGNICPEHSGQFALGITAWDLPLGQFVLRISAWDSLPQGFQLWTVCPWDFCLGFALGISAWDSLCSGFVPSGNPKGKSQAVIPRANCPECSGQMLPVQSPNFKWRRNHNALLFILFRLSQVVIPRANPKQ